MSYLNQADGSGKLDIGGKQWPIAYQIISEDDSGGTKTVHVELSAPRDWLLERGFRSEAKLIRENGVEIDIRSPAEIGVDDPIAIRLRSDSAKIASEQEALDRFPELTTH
ncbi:hypothetical protein [Rhizobium sp.]